MAILDFQRPDKVIMLESDDFKGTFENYNLYDKRFSRILSLIA